MVQIVRSECVICIQIRHNVMPRRPLANIACNARPCANSASAAEMNAFVTDTIPMQDCLIILTVIRDDNGFPVFMLQGEYTLNCGNYMILRLIGRNNNGYMRHDCFVWL